MMENRRRHQNRQMPHRRKNLTGNASSATNSVTIKQNAAKKPVMLRMERSEGETGSKPQKTNLSPIESWYARFVGTPAIPPNSSTKQPETSKSLHLPTDAIRETNTRKRRCEIRGIMKQAPKVNHLKGVCGFDGQLEYENEYDDDEPLN